MNSTARRNESAVRYGHRPAWRVLVAEDNEANRGVIMLMLKRLGIEAKVVADGEQLLAALKEKPVDLIFMDLQMPVMDGLEATALIRAGEAGGAVKDVIIIALTANAMPGAEERCLSAGMDGYLPKPLRVSDLEAEMSRFLEV